MKLPYLSRKFQFNFEQFANYLKSFRNCYTSLSYFNLELKQLKGCSVMVLEKAGGYWQKVDLSSSNTQAHTCVPAPMPSIPGEGFAPPPLPARRG